MSDTPLYDQTVDEVGKPPTGDYVEQVDHLPDDGDPETIDSPVQSTDDDGVDGNSTPNGGA